MNRYYLGVDWGDTMHAVWVCDDTGEKVKKLEVKQTPEGMSEFGRWLHERTAKGIELWAGIEKPEGRIVDFLLDHEVVVYPINPKAVDRYRDRIRTSRSKCDMFDAYVLSEFVRTDHAHLHALKPSSEPAQELKILTRDYQRLVRQQTRLINQLKATLKEYYPRPLEVFGDVTTKTALAFLKTYPTPESLNKLTKKQGQQFAKAHALNPEEFRELLRKPQLPIPAHVVRAKSRLVEVLVEQLKVTVGAVAKYREVVEDFFASMPAKKLSETLPGGKSGTTVPTLWAELGDAEGRWKSFKHLQAQAGAVPVTEQSGKSQFVHFRFACNKRLRYAVDWLAFISLRQSEWAKAYYQTQRNRGHSHHQALRALGAKWLKILFVMWRDNAPYNENYHLANIARDHLRQAA
ncbi:MAG: IS110 family transposase [Candidatus Latescibacteria bacterium]|nr:IS110 family transposase [Candidatus Latescibacterota bacterium]